METKYEFSNSNEWNKKYDYLQKHGTREEQEEHLNKPYPDPE